MTGLPHTLQQGDATGVTFPGICLGHVSEAEDLRRSDLNHPASVIIPKPAQPEESDEVFVNNDKENIRPAAPTAREALCSESKSFGHLICLSPKHLLLTL